MRKLIALKAVFLAALLFGSSAAWAGGVTFINTADSQLKFFTQGVMSNGSTTEWHLWHVHAGHHTRIKCQGCVSFNFEIRTDGRHPVKYSLEIDKSYKLRYNAQRQNWDLFQ